MDENHSQYFKNYRQKIGFQNQNDAKNFLSAKDLVSSIDFEYIESLNSRIIMILDKINLIIDDKIKQKDIRTFANKFINTSYNKIKCAGLLPKLNNQGRRPEEVLISWLQCYALTEFFTPAISKIFSVKINDISQIGADDLKNIETFMRSAKTNMEIVIKQKRLRLEVQSGFQGINDIKEHKVREARTVFAEKKIKTVCIHIDLFNGQVAFVQLDSIQGDDINWVTRQQMEGQTVFAIEQNYFKWRLLDQLPTFKDLEIEV
jgi:hypothetical protein